MIKYLGDEFEFKKFDLKNGFNKFKTIIDYVFDCLENNDEKNKLIESHSKSGKIHISKISI